MAAKFTLPFYSNFVSDGSTTNLSLDLKTGPIGILPPFGATNNTFLSPLFSGLPSAVRNVTSSVGSVTVNSLTLGVLSVTLSAAGTSGTTYSLIGDMDF